MMILDGTLPATLGVLLAIPDPASRLRAFTGTIIARGGTIVLPPDASHGDDHWGPLYVEFSLHSILGTGLTAEEAMADWITCATRQVQAERVIRTLDAPAADLRDAAIQVRVRSEDRALIDRAATVERAIATGALQ